MQVEGDHQDKKRAVSATDLEQPYELKKQKLDYAENKPRRYDQLKAVVRDAQVIQEEALQILQNYKTGKVNKNEATAMIQKMITESQKFVDTLSQDVVQTTKEVQKNSDMGVVIKNLPEDWNQDRLVMFLSKKNLKFLEVEKEVGSTKAKILLQSLDEEEQMFQQLDGFKIQTKWLGVYKSSEQHEQNVESEKEGQHPRSLRGGKTAEASEDQSGGGQTSEEGVNNGEQPKGVKKGESRDIRDMVTPLWQLAYKDQLVMKHAKLFEELQKVTQNAKWIHSKLKRPKWLDEVLKQDEEQSVACCPIEGILQSPQLTGYRNKTEFTIGYDLEGKPTIGFLLGSFKAGITAVSEASDCPNISPLAIKFARIVQDFIRNSSQLTVWDKRLNEGFWRLLVVREARNETFLPLPGDRFEYQNESQEDVTFKNLEWQKWMVRVDGEHQQEQQTGGNQHASIEDVTDNRMESPEVDEAMVVVQINPEPFDKEKVQSELAALENHIRQQTLEQNIKCKIVLLVQHHAGISNSAPYTSPLQPFPSESQRDVQDMFIIDTLLNLKFQISYQAFFQVNSGAAACLYALVGQWANVGPKTLLLDICCGTGTIGLTLAGMAKKVIGIDNVQSAIKDAKLNAKLNNIDNCSWICGTAESKIKFILQENEHLLGPDKEFDEVVAVVDPPRAGLHKSVISAILNCPHVKRLVYVSCNPETLSGNLVKFCSIRQYNVNDPNWKEYIPFTPVKAVAVDLFPSTKHCEGVVLLQRD